MNDYEWDVFISYRRFDKWSIWIDRFFKPYLCRELQIELGRKAEVFVDRDNLIEGAHWPNNLRNALTGSRVLIPIICARYWDSLWCKREIALMLERENKTGLREKYPTASLIIPVILHDGDRIPETISLLHSFDAKRYAKTQLSSKAGLETLMNTIACRVAMHHKSCPAFDPQWQEITGDSYLDLLKPKTDELTYPSLGKAGS